jgi:hypothetical protein
MTLRTFTIAVAKSMRCPQLRVSPRRAPARAEQFHVPIWEPLTPTLAKLCGKNLRERLLSEGYNRLHRMPIPEHITEGLAVCGPSVCIRALRQWTPVEGYLMRLDVLASKRR